MKLNLLNESLPTIWYEDEAGNKYIPKVENPYEDIPPKEFKYFHSRFPNILKHDILVKIDKDEIAKCNHPKEFVRINHDLIDGVEGEICDKCGGHRLKENGIWGDWEGSGTRPFMSFDSSWSNDLVLAMANSGDYNLNDAIIVAATSCERCMNALAHQYDLDWGYPKFSKKWVESNTRCEFCED